MKPRDKFIAALERRPVTGRVPHFELEFFLTMEAFGRVHPSQRHYNQWLQMTESERDLHRRDVADLHVTVARHYETAGMLWHTPHGWEFDDIRLSLEHLRKLSGDEFFLNLHGDATYAIPSGTDMVEFSARLYEQPQAVKDEAQRRVDKALARGRRIHSWGLVDGFALCADYCFNDRPFMSPTMFDEFITPYLIQLVAGYKEMGFYVIKHTDGNIMPILDALMASQPHAIHSLDPQGNVDIAEMKRLIGDKVCLMGNVNCALLQSGTEAEAAASVRYALQHGMPGGGYIFGTSNCIYTGMPLERYHMMLDIWRREGNYPD